MLFNFVVLTATQVSQRVALANSGSAGLFERTVVHGLDRVKIMHTYAYIII